MTKEEGGLDPGDSLMPKADGLVERVARAIHEGERDAFGAYSWEALDEPERGWYFDQARAALAEIEAAGFVIVPREPTKEMLECFCCYEESDDEIREFWSNALSAAPKTGG